MFDFTEKRFTKSLKLVLYYIDPTCIDQNKWIFLWFLLSYRTITLYANKKYLRSYHKIEIRNKFSMSIVYMTIAKPIFERIFAFYNHTTASPLDNTLFKCSVNNRISSILNLILNASSLNWIIYIFTWRVKALELLMIG